jgi:inhibitor of KinA
MTNERVKIFSLGENALTISFGNEISLELNKRVLNLSRHFEENRFPGFVETVAAYASLSIFYDCFRVKRNFPEFATAFEAVKNFAENTLHNLAEISEDKSRLIKIPVSFIKDFALDLELVAAENNLSTKDVIDIFTERTYRVYMLGFLPGFAYMGEVDRRIAIPRKQTPRTLVPAGSVGIAGRQTGIYSLASPGGWQIVGKTNVKLFTPKSKSPTFLQAGDNVQFYAADF